jgi:RNA polymerase sigma factor (sigma-70 family)
MPPPPASNLASRLFLGPALRMQPDRRLVSLVRDGYESAFEEIVRRYGRPLGRYAAAIVPSHRAEDVTQDAFSKALLALRGTRQEIELRPWLYRIVRNTALSDLRDQPPAAAELHEGIDGVETPVEAAERRAEMADLLDRLRALPDPQRTAIVMRELEGLSHEEIAAHLGVTGNAARQTIYRARRALRDGAGMLLPLPALQYLLGGGGAAAGAGLAGAGGAGVAASAGGAGAGTALKAGLATVVVAGSVATGVALHEGGHHKRSGAETAVAAGAKPKADGRAGSASAGDDAPGGFERNHGGPGPGRNGGEREAGDRHGGSGEEGSQGSGGSGSGESGHGGSGGGGGETQAGTEGQAGGGHDGHDGSGGRSGPGGGSETIVLDSSGPSGGSSGSGDLLDGSSSGGSSGTGSSSGSGSGSSGEG